MPAKGETQKRAAARTRGTGHQFFLTRVYTGVFGSLIIKNSFFCTIRIYLLCCGKMPCFKGFWGNREQLTCSVPDPLFHHCQCDQEMTVVSVAPVVPVFWREMRVTVVPLGNHRIKRMTVNLLGDDRLGLASDGQGIQIHGFCRFSSQGCDTRYSLYLKVPIGAKKIMHIEKFTQRLPWLTRWPCRRSRSSFRLPLYIFYVLLFKNIYRTVTRSTCDFCDKRWFVAAVAASPGYPLIYFLFIIFWKHI